MSRRLQYKNFKKVHEDANSATLQHPEGHTIKIAKGALSDHIKKQLGALPFAEGGEVLDESNSEPQYVNGKEVGRTAKATHRPDVFGNVADYKPENTDRTPVSTPKDNSNVRTTPEGTSNAFHHAFGLADGGEVPDSEQPVPEQVTEQAAPSGASGSWDAAAQDAGPANQPQKAAPDVYAEYLNKTGQGINEEKAARTEAGNAESQAYATQAQAQENNAAYAYQEQQDYQAKNNALTAERAAFVKDIQSNMIDPNKYIHDMGTGQKIRTAIGLIIGGLGGGGNNGATKFLDNQIQNSIAAQEKNQGIRQNLLSANQAQFGDNNNAYAMTRIMHNDYVKSLVDQAAAKSGSITAVQNARMLNAQLDQHSAMLQAQIAANMKRPGSQSMTSIPPEMMDPKMRERIVPMPDGSMRMGYTKEDADKVKEQLSTVQPIMSQLDRLDQLGATALVPGSKAANQAEAIRSELVPLLNENAGLKRLSEVDVHNLQRQVNDPSSFRQLIGGKARSDTLRRFIQDKMSATAGVRLEGGSGPARAAIRSFKPSR